MNSMILNILNTCLELKEYGVDAFFEYHPHVEAVQVRVYLSGWEDDDELREEPTYFKTYLDWDFVPDGNVSVKGLEEELVRLLSEVKNDR